MRTIKGALIIATMLISTFFIIQKTEAIQGEAKVYVINLSGVPGSWVGDPSRAKDGAVDACILRGTHIQGNSPRAHPKENVDYPPYYDAAPAVVTSWNLYRGIFEGFSGVVVVNTHGEYLPVPSGYTREQWVDKIAQAMLNRRLTWVHVGGYTFFRVWYEQTGTWEEWGAAGFQYFMNYINKGSVDLWPSPYSENDITTSLLSGSNQIGINWEDGYGRLVGNYDEATLGRPLKINDFKDYLIMPMFKFAEKLAAAVIVFAKAGARYTGDYGVGTYVHIGVGNLYDMNHNPIDADYGRGFIGTAAALWIESQGFNPGFDDAVEDSIFGPESRKAGIKVHPSVSGVYYEGLTLKVRMEFAIYGLLKGHRDDGSFVPDHVVFNVFNLPAPWNDVEMKTDLDLSKEASGEAPQLQGLYPANENEAPFGIAPSAITWFLGKAGVYAYPALSDILLVTGGFKLLGEWLKQGDRKWYSGINTFASWTGFDYVPRWRYTTIGDQNVIEYNSIIAVEFKLPLGTRGPGWLKMPITYEVGAVTQILACQLVVQNTIELAIWFDGGGQEDAGIPNDAGDSYGDARTVSFPTSFHGYLGGGDNQDWYTFNMDSGKRIRITMTPPPYVDFDLELYSPINSTTPKAGSHQGEGSIDSITYTTGESGYWKVKVNQAQKSGVYTLKLTYPSSGGGSYCPFVSVWNGTSYVPDNNLLPASSTSNGADVEDYYKLEKSPAQRNGKYSFILSEFGNDHSYFDQVKLMAVDHEPSVNIAVTPSGEILTYNNPTAPISAIDNYGNNRLNEIRFMDGNVSDAATYFQGYPDSYLILNFGKVESDNAKLILRDDQKKQDDTTCILVQMKDGSGAWQTVETLVPRAYWSMEAVNLSPYVVQGQDFTVRLYWLQTHRLDFVGLDVTSQANYDIRNGTLVSATHSTQGDVKTQLLENDNVYVELVPGQQIQLEFTLPNNSKEARTYILYTKGRYTTIP